MSEAFKHIRNFTGTEADIFLYGDIGYDVTAKTFVDELKWAIDYAGATKVNIRINSNGGLVTDGLGIYGAVMAFREKGIIINTWNDGIAASIAGVILMSGEKIYMISHGLLMVHKAWTDGQMDDKIKNALDAMNESIVKVFTERGKMTADEMAIMLDDETWLNSERSKELGLIDEVYKQPAAVNVASVSAIYNKCKTKIKMQKVVQYLNLAETATEDEVVAAIEAAKVQEVDPKVAEMEAEITELKKKLADFEAEKAAKEAAEIEAKAVEAVENAISKGLFEEAEKATLLDKAKNNIEDFTFMVERMKVPHASVSEAIKNQADDRSNWTFRDWTTKDAKGFENLEKSNPELFNKILKTAGKR